ncbi:MAG: WG repeat-containing protein [Bacteroidaceae bacterium]|nr:WG repeat-containing protein [Bacteroidaceae bacterium]
MIEDLKTYHPGAFSIRRQEVLTNISILKSSSYSLLLNIDLLSSVNLYLIPFVDINGKIGFIDQQGKVIVEPLYEKINGAFHYKNNYVAVFRDKKWTIINSAGKEILESVSSTLKPGYDCELVTVQNQNKSKVINLLTKKTIVNGEFDYIGGFRYGYARVKKNNKWGIIDQLGEIVLPVEYEEIYSFYNYPEPTTQIRKPDEKKMTKISLANFRKE